MSRVRLALTIRQDGTSKYVEARLEGENLIPLTP